MHGNATLNFRNDPKSECSAYADSYYDAAKCLVDKVLHSNGYSDTVICPIIFLYRHSVELYLKHIILTYNKFNSKNIKQKEDLITHDLKKLFSYAKERLIKLDLWDEENWEDHDYGYKLTELVDYLSMLDASSFVFRYPFNTKDEATLKPHFKLNLFEFSDKANRICDRLDGACMVVDYAWDCFCDSVMYR